MGLSSAQINAKDETAVNEYNANLKEHQSGINELKRIKLEGLPLGLSLDTKIVSKNSCTIGEFILDSQEARQQNGGEIGLIRHITHAHINQRENDSTITLYSPDIDNKWMKSFTIKHLIPTLANEIKEQKSTLLKRIKMNGRPIEDEQNEDNKRDEAMIDSNKSNEIQGLLETLVQTNIDLVQQVNDMKGSVGEMSNRIGALEAMVEHQTVEIRQLKRQKTSDASTIRGGGEDQDQTERTPWDVTLNKYDAQYS